MMYTAFNIWLELGDCYFWTVMAHTVLMSSLVTVIRKKSFNSVYLPIQHISSNHWMLQFFNLTNIDMLKLWTMPHKWVVKISIKLNSYHLLQQSNKKLLCPILFELVFAKPVSSHTILLLFYNKCKNMYHQQHFLILMLSGPHYHQVLLKSF